MGCTVRTSRPCHENGASARAISFISTFQIFLRNLLSSYRSFTSTSLHGAPLGLGVARPMAGQSLSFSNQANRNLLVHLFAPHHSYAVQKSRKISIQSPWIFWVSNNGNRGNHKLLDFVHRPLLTLNSKPSPSSDFKSKNIQTILLDARKAQHIQFINIPPPLSNKPDQRIIQPSPDKTSLAKTSEHSNHKISHQAPDQLLD